MMVDYYQSRGNTTIAKLVNRLGLEIVNVTRESSNHEKHKIRQPERQGLPGDACNIEAY